MNDEYFIYRSEKQIENINNKLIKFRAEKKDIENQIEDLVSIRDLLKKGIKISNK